MTATADRFRRRAAAFEATVGAVAPEQWPEPTPCAKWLARDVVAHVVEFGEAVAGLRPRGAGPTSPAPPGFDPVAAFRSFRVEVEAILDDPTTDPELVKAIDLEVSVDLPQHRWDLAKATGQPATIDPEDVEELWAALSTFTPRQWEFMRTPGNFGPGIEVYGPEVPVSPDASAHDRLLGLIGRDPGWTRAGDKV
jgi:uncharacterized protein (TIGR03086 family)